MSKCCVNQPTCSILKVDFAWMQHMLYHLNVGLVLENGALSSQPDTEGEIRKSIVEAVLVESIIAMPSQLFYNMQIPYGLHIENV